jgi:two-component system phosphate regulon sensor histidine kinase PhoR
MKKHFIRRIFLLYFIVLLIIALFVELYVGNVLRTSYLENSRNSLSLQADLIADRLTISDPEMIDRRCKELGQKINAHITVTNSDGGVLGDSHNYISDMEGNIIPPEIKQALLRGTGWSVEDEYFSVARKIIKDEHAIVIRLTVPLKELNKSVNDLRLKIDLAVIMLLLISGAIFVFQTVRIKKYVSQLADYSGAIVHGLFRKRPEIEDSGQFSEIAWNLDAISSDMKTSAERIGEETNRLNVILRNIPDALLLINVNNNIEVANNRARDLFGNPVLEGKAISEVVGSPHLQTLIDGVKQKKMPGSGELTIDFPEKRYMMVLLSPLSYKVGELAGIVALFHDITDFRKLEQVRRDFVANVSHELKTPVTAIKGFAETLLDGAIHDSKNAEKFLGTIKSHSERMNRLVEDLLTLSSIELKEIKINKTGVNFANVAESAAQTMIVHAASKDIVIRQNIKDKEAVIHADRDRLEQILLNLMDNAIKFTEKGDIEIGISREDGRSYFYVRDTGMGIPEKFIPRLGERFFRVDPSRSRELGGTGLGLAIVKHLVMAHGWKMKIESEVSKGTAVKVYY